ncbi:F0F1 ATP synthase subunit alpha [Candidatus Microgenomates bacterium]|nr:F0F1 ATP synthase subunit alpha [Candidatus Microgenomates bacterium]
MTKSTDEILIQLQKKLNAFGFEPGLTNVGTVEQMGDGVVTVSGLSKVAMGEMVEFEDGSTGFAFNLDEDYVSVILLSTKTAITSGSQARKTGNFLSIGAAEAFLGRVVSPLGEPLDGKPGIKAAKMMPLERIAPGVVLRKSVNTPLFTGIKSIDSMIPIGRGQRELIIGDRSTGKTSIALDAIINQKVARGSRRKQVLCIYVAIGQKQGNVAQIVDKLGEKGALSYTIIVAAGASDGAALQYIAPFAGCAIAEYFLQKGQDVLIVYDDLTKHSFAYRQLSLVLKRPAGREAYPGDIFYLHSRLLERAVCLNEKNGGGSITALPIVETQAADVSAYIPTNIISITDGQIYLESDLFNAGIRPAINAGISVSRVGGAAQTPIMRKIAGPLRLDLAQYRELAAFAQFGSDLDKATQTRLDRGARITEVLKQTNYAPMRQAHQVAIIWAVTNGFLDDIAIDDVSRFEIEFIEYLENVEKKLIDKIDKEEKLTDEIAKDLEKEVIKFKKRFKI